MTTIALETAVLSNTSATLGDRIAAAAALWELIEECEAALKPFKDEVRAMAVAAGNPTMTINGTGMCQCKVVVPGASLKLREGLSVEGERAALGELFGTVFEVKLALRSTSPAVAATLPPAAQAHLATVTSLVANTPRVSLKVLLGVQEISVLALRVHSHMLKRGGINMHQDAGTLFHVFGEGFFIYDEEGNEVSTFSEEDEFNRLIKKFRHREFMRKELEEMFGVKLDFGLNNSLVIDGAAIEGVSWGLPVDASEQRQQTEKLKLTIEAYWTEKSQVIDGVGKLNELPSRIEGDLADEPRSVQKANSYQ